MRLRVLLPLMLFGLIAVAAALFPAAKSIAVTRTQELSLQRTDTMNAILEHVTSAATSGDHTSLRNYLTRVHDMYGEAIIVKGEGRHVVAAVGSIPDSARVDAIALAAARGLPQMHVPTIYPWGSETALIAQSASVKGVQCCVVIMSVDLSAAKADVLQSWSVAAGIAMLLLSLLLWAAAVLTRWVLRPVRALDSAANRLAENHELESVQLSGPPELRRLAASFIRMTQRMDAAMEQQRGFASDASHQLRNPLAAVRLRIDALGEETDAAEIAAIDSDLDRLESSIARMLELADAEHRAMIEGSGHSVSIEGVTDDIATVVPVEQLPEFVHDPHAAVQVDAHGVIPCRPHDLEDILDNLVDNARKYAGAQAEVSVRIFRRQERIILDVADNGPGLSKADLAKVGERFWRSPSHHDLPGTGLGIAVVDQLARANGATTSVHRVNPSGLRVRVEWAEAG